MTIHESTRTNTKGVSVISCYFVDRISGPRFFWFFAQLQQFSINVCAALRLSRVRNLIHFKPLHRNLFQFHSAKVIPLLPQVEGLKRASKAAKRAATSNSV